MKRSLISLFLVVAVISLHAVQKERYPVSQIPDSLRMDAYSVVRFESTDFEYIDSRNGVEKGTRVVTILNEKGKDEANFQKGLGKYWELKKFSGEILDQTGKLIRKINMSDLHTSTLSAELATDERFSFYVCNQPTYPFTVIYEYEVKWQNGMIEFPVFAPMEALQQSVEHAVYHLTLPEGTKFMLHALHMSDRADSVKVKDQVVYSWTLNGLKAIDEEPYMPKLDKVVPMLQLKPDDFSYDKSSGSLHTWNDLGKWSWELLAQRDQLAPSTIEKVKGIVAGATSNREKVKRLYAYLQQTTRYVSIQLGIGGYQPIAAASVCQTGFGDCKGLTNYMRAMLEAINIPSYYTIISTDHKRFFPDFASPRQADHVILMVPLGKDTIPLECTSSALPFGYVHTDIAGHDALLVTPEGGRLCRLPTYPDSAEDVHTLLRIDLDKSGSMQAKARSVYNLARYEEMISFEKMADNEERTKMIKADYRLPSMQIDKIIVTEKPDSLPSMTLDYTFSSNLYANQSGTRLFVPINPRKNKYPIFSQKERKYSFVIDGGSVECDTILLTIPNEMKVEKMPSDVVLNNKIGKFSSHLSMQGNTLQIVQHVYIPKEELPASYNDEFKSFMNEINQAYAAEIVLKKR
jgi:hypothetical protein